MGGATIVIRAAKPADLPARLQLITESLADTYTEAFLYFFFQELTLQAVVLGGAVLFIFCGVSVWGCALLLPAAALLVWAAVRLHAVSVASNTAAKIRGEEEGWVAELRGPLFSSPSQFVRVVNDEDLFDYEDIEPQHKQIVGTISVCGRRGDPAAGWVCALAVARGWRRRGAGGALLARAGAGARAGGGGGGRAALAAVTSHLQPAARALLHKHGWECRGTYHRQLLGDALTLPMAQLTLDLPHA